MKRRVFDTTGAEYGWPAGQVLVTFDPESDLMRLAIRPNSWDTWSRPLPLLATDDDAELPGSRHYGDDGRGFVVAHVEPDAVTVVLTGAEAERLYASAAFYEANVERMEGVGDYDVLVAHSALTKLAQALHPESSPRQNRTPLVATPERGRDVGP